MTPDQLARLKHLYVAFGKCLEFAQDCHCYANADWEWKYGDGWRKENQDAERALKEFEKLLNEIKGVP